LSCLFYTAIPHGVEAVCSFDLSMLTFLVIVLFPFLVGASIVTFQNNDNSLILENGYSKFVFSKSALRLDEIYADFSGASSYGINVLDMPYQLEVNFGTTKVCDQISSQIKFSTRKVGDIIELEMSGSENCVIETPLFSETWVVSLAPYHRYLDVKVSGKTLKSTEIISAYHGLYVHSASMYALFDRGVVQMMNNKGKCLGSNQSISHIYWVGNGTSLDYTRQDNTDRNVVLISESEHFEAGLQDILLGNYPRMSLVMENAWSRSCWNDAVSISTSTNWEYLYNIKLGPNNMDFPVNLLPDASKQTNIPLVDIQTFLIGIYASPVGCLQSYYEGHWGTIAPTISHPDVGRCM
jgi:hypothetical protein